jgi:hypothetical protein
MSATYRQQLSCLDACLHYQLLQLLVLLGMAGKPKPTEHILTAPLLLLHVCLFSLLRIWVHQSTEPLLLLPALLNLLLLQVLLVLAELQRCNAW